jgi:DNA repair protein RadD
MLRDYQQNAHDKVMAHLKKSLDPCLINAPTGAGKSHIIAAIAKTLYGASNKRILCLAPSKELIRQNHDKYIATGNQASIYSASITKSLRYPVVFGTPLSVKNDIKHFKDQFCAVIVDEAHRTTKSIVDIIDKLRSINDKLRVIGLTATPQRLGEGLIYGDDKFYTHVY